jgi:hypothetical protein
MPEWIIGAKEYWQRLGLSDAINFRQKMHLPEVGAVENIIPLRDLKQVLSIVPIERNVLLEIVRKIKTLDGRSVYENACIQMFKVDPRQLKVGQKFAYRENYTQLLEEVTNTFDRFVIPGGISELGAYFLFGLDANGKYSMSFYVPPILERHGNEIAIMDGIHRDFIMMKAGTTIQAIVVDGVSLPFPCSLHSWSELEVISLKDKPKDINERYFDLQKGLFRDVKFLGIDG